MDLARMAFGAPLVLDGLPLLPDGKVNDWRVIEVLRPLLFAITAELHQAGDSFVENLPEACRIWNPQMAQTTLKEAIKSSIEKSSDWKKWFFDDPRMSSWISHQPFSARRFAMVVDEMIPRGDRIEAGALDGLMANLQVPAAGHRIPAYLGRRLRLMKEGIF